MLTLKGLCTLRLYATIFWETELNTNSLRLCLLNNVIALVILYRMGWNHNQLVCELFEGDNHDFVGTDAITGALCASFLCGMKYLILLS
jgi:hypothetical protein